MATSTCSSPTTARARCIATRRGSRSPRWRKASGIDLNGHGVTSAWGDLDNDGLPDLYVGNFIAGQPLYRDALFVNRGAAGGAWRFAEALPDVILKHDATHGVQFVDFDGDGRLDLSLTNNDPNGGGHPLLRNTAPTRGRGFFVEVTDAAGRRTLAGSEVRVFQPRTRQLLAAALVDAGSGYCSQNAMPVTPRRARHVEGPRRCRGDHHHRRPAPRHDHQGRRSRRACPSPARDSCRRLIACTNLTPTGQFLRRRPPRRQARLG